MVLFVEIGINTLNFWFIHPEIQAFSKTVFLSGVEDKGVWPPLPKQRHERWPKDLEYQTDKTEVQVIGAVSI